MFYNFASILEVEKRNGKKNIVFPKTGDLVKIEYLESFVNVFPKFKNLLYKARFFSGLCVGVKRKGLSTRIILRNVLKKNAIELSFFVYSKNVMAMKSLRPNFRFSKSKIYFLRKKSNYYNKTKIFSSY